MKRFLALVSATAFWSAGIGCSPETRSKAEEQKPAEQKSTAPKEADSKAGDAKPAAPKVAAEAKQVLSDWYTALAAAKTFQCDTQGVFAVKQNGAEVQADSEAFTFTAERPNKVALRAKKPGAPTLVCDGEKLYYLDSAKGIYTLGAAPKSFAELDKTLMLSNFNQSQGLSIVGDALAGKTLDQILAGYETIEYVGAEDVDGKKRHHLRVAQDGIHTDWWFAADAGTQLLASAPNAKEMAAKNGKELPPGIELVLRASFDQWVYGATASADTFKIDPPTDASLVDDLEAPLALTLVGKPAPAFEAKNLKGETVKLADLAGKIVVVDFWATWCPPCVAGLPKLAAMTAKHKDDGVVFVAINLQEDESTVKEFLDAKKLEINVVLDTDNKIMQKYKVEPVPQTVFIDRKGVVQVVHIGIGEIEEIPKQLEELIAGKDLAHAEKKK